MTRKSIRTTRSCAEFAQHHNLSDDAAEELHELVRNGVSGGMGERYVANSPSLFDHDRSKWRKCGLAPPTEPAGGYWRCSRRRHSRSETLGDPCTVADPVTRVHYYLCASSEARQHLSNAVVAVTDFDRGRACAPAFDGKDRPIPAFAEQCAHRQRQRVIGAPDGGMHDHPVVMAKPRPRL